MGATPTWYASTSPKSPSGLYYGHAGNTGDAVLWGEALGARLGHLSGYQGHGSLAHPHGILISWALMTEGGIQVNTAGRRFPTRARGYSEQAVEVLAQPGGVAWNIYDEAIHGFALGFPDYREAIAAGAVMQAGSLSRLAAEIGVSAEALTDTFEAVEAARRNSRRDRFGRDFSPVPALSSPYRAVKVTGALFHTQGGLDINGEARVVRKNGLPFPNLFAAGGAARGVSGPSVDGYLSGNGLLTAIAFGHVAGEHAASLARRRRSVGNVPARS